MLEEEVRPVEAAEAKGYVVSFTGGSNFRRLHYVGRCYRKPGVHYHLFEAFGEDGKATSQHFDAVCKDC